MPSNSVGSCERCDAEIPADAMSCPDCGYEDPWTRRRRLVVTVLGALAMAASTLAVAFIVLLWGVNEARPAFPIGAVATWITPGFVGAALLYAARNRPRRTATGEPAS